MGISELSALVINACRDLGDKILKPEYQGKPFPAGHCYVASEAFYHLYGCEKLKPMRIKHEGSSHWYLECRPPDLAWTIDLTDGQFETPVPYDRGVGCGFLTKAPSRRAQLVIDQVHRLSMVLDPINKPCYHPTPDT